MYLGDPTKLKDALIFVNNPPASEPTQRNSWPFTAIISAGDTGSHYIDLYSQYSRSRPYQEPQSRWGHLLPQWRFTDLDGNVIEKIKTTDTQITDISGNVIGVTGIAQFYYIDDMPSFNYASPLMIWATMEVSGIPVSYEFQGLPLPGYANSKIIKGEPYYINGQPPTHLSITSNGIADISKLKWVRNPFRFTTVIQSDWLSQYCGDAAGDITIFDYPQEAAEQFASENELHRDLLYVTPSAENWLPLSAYFIREDPETDLHMGGFTIGSLESTDEALNTQISAWVNIQSWGWFRDTPYVWISNAPFRRLNRVGLPYEFGGVTYTNPLLPNIQTYSYNLSGIGSFSTETSSVSGTSYWYDGSLTVDVFGGIHGMAVGPCLDVWAVDPELDQLYHFDVSGEMLTAIDISPSGSSPQSICLDGNLNKWVTLYGATSAIKFDVEGNLLTAVAVPPYNITDQFPLTGNNPDSIMVRPVQVETDTDNNIWVSYEHALSSMVLKYDEEGMFITACNLPISAQPQGLIVDSRDNSIWVSNTYEILVDPMSWTYAASGGSIQHFTSGGDLIETYKDIPHPGYMSFDVNSNLWFTFGFAGVGIISGSEVKQYWLTAGEMVDYSSEHIAIDDSQLGFNDRIKGIAVDGRNRVWALNSRDAQAFVINVDDISEYTVVSIIPQDTIRVEFGIQGLDDWTGWRWLQKYYYPQGIPLVYSISGISNEFNVDEYNDNFEIRKFNESWDATEQIHNYALPEHVYENINLFDNYFRVMVGGLSSQEESIGRKSYERTANFVQNHVDIDTCGIDQLYSIAKQLDVPIDDYKLSFPVSLKRLIDLVSINHQKLWGTRCRCKKNFEPRSNGCTICGHSHCLNRSVAPINTNTYFITGGQDVVIRPVFGPHNYDILTTSTTILSSGSSVNVYPISAASSISWLASSNYNKYYFYTYIPIYCDVQVEGVINWDDRFTTLSENNSSIETWYNENGIVDVILNHDLHEGLQF